MNGDDILVGGAGADLLDGGNGLDTADYSTSKSPVHLVLGGVSSGGDAQGDTLVSSALQGRMSSTARPASAAFPPMEAAGQTRCSAASAMILEHRRRSWTCCLRRTCRGGRYARRRRWQRYDHGFGGNDSISDGNGDDTIDGGDGDDWFTFLGFDGSETVNGGATTGVPSGLLKSTYFRGPHRGPPVATVFRMLRSS